jgi:hypothetical protein
MSTHGPAAFPSIRASLCWLALFLLLISLPLPAVDMTSSFAGRATGLGCLITGFFFWPSNLALLASPFVAASKARRLQRTIGLFLLLSLIVALALTLTPVFFWKTHAAFWLWCSSLGISAIALLLPAHSLIDPGGRAPPPPAGA